MIQKVGFGVLAGLASLVLFLSAGAGSAVALVPTFFSPLPIFLVGLSLGTTSAILGTGTVFLFLATAGGLPSAAIYLAGFGLPIIILTYYALLNRTTANENQDTAVEWYPPGLLLIWLVGIACGLFTLLFVGTWGQEGGLPGQATRFFGEMLGGTEQTQEILNLLNMEITAEEYIAFAGPIWPIMTCLSIVPIMAANAGLAQRWLVRLGKSIRPSPKVLTMTLPESFLMVFVFAALLSLVSGQIGYLGSGLATILIVPYFLLGLTVVHAISSAWPGRSFGLTVFYLALLLFTLIAPIVAFVGMAEPWLKLKQRFASDGADQPKSQGD